MLRDNPYMAKTNVQGEFQIPKLPVGEHTFRMIPVDNTSTAWLNYFRAWAIIGLVDITAQTLFQARVTTNIGTKDQISSAENRYA